MATHVYWDKVLVKDDAVPSEIFDRLLKYSEDQEQLSDGYLLDNDNYSKTNYQYAESDFQYFTDWLLESGLIPKLPEHNIVVASRYHFMSEGGKMDWHTDAIYSIAATLYLGECEGGELQVSSECQTQSIMISPVLNRIVVIKCDQMHRVLPVLRGERPSIQVFITYSPVID